MELYFHGDFLDKQCWAVLPTAWDIITSSTLFHATQTGKENTRGEVRLLFASVKDLKSIFFSNLLCLNLMPILTQYRGPHRELLYKAQTQSSPIQLHTSLGLQWTSSYQGFKDCICFCHHYVIWISRGICAVELSHMVQWLFSHSFHAKNGQTCVNQTEQRTPFSPHQFSPVSSRISSLQGIRYASFFFLFFFKLHTPCTEKGCPVHIRNKHNAAVSFTLLLTSSIFNNSPCTAFTFCWGNRYSLLHTKMPGGSQYSALWGQCSHAGVKTHLKNLTCYLWLIAASVIWDSERWSPNETI